MPHVTTDDGVKLYYEETGSGEPVLFILEDLHWLDPTTLEFVSMLVEEGANDCLMSLLTFRPEFSTPWTSSAHQTQVALNRLTKKQVGEMMRAADGVLHVADAPVAAQPQHVPPAVSRAAAVVNEQHGVAARREELGIRFPTGSCL